MNETDLSFMADQYFKHLQVLNYARSTITSKKRLLNYFIHWCYLSDISCIDQVSRDLLEDYQRHLYNYRKKDGEPLQFATQRERLMTIKDYFHWLAGHRYLPFNPASEIELPFVEKRLPGAILTVYEIERILQQINLDTPLGLRDRAIIETFYSTGIRREELTKLTKYDLDLERSTLMIRQGKGKKDRLIPIGKRALSWVKKYMSFARPYLLGEKEDSSHLFLTIRGNGIAPGTLSFRIRQYFDKAGIKKEGSCHIFRHTMATLMLEGGAELRYIQEMLGHAAITSTQIYTRVSIKTLQEIHEQAHPAKVHPLRNRKKTKE